MPPAFSWFLALRYLLTRWVNLIGIFGIAISVWSMIIVIAIVSGIIDDTRRGIASASPDLLVTKLTKQADFFELGPALREIEGVAAVAPRLSQDVMMFRRGGGRAWSAATQALGTSTSAASNNYVLLVGIDADLEDKTTSFRDWLGPDEKGNDPPVRVESLDRPFDVSPERISKARRTLGLSPQALLSSQPGFLVSVDRGKYGDQLTPGQGFDMVSARFAANGQILQIKQTLYFAGNYRTKHRFLDMSVCFTDIERMRGMMGGGGRFGPELVTEVAIRLVAGADLSAVKSRIDTRMESLGGGEALDWEAQNEVYLRAVDRERMLLKLVLFAVLIVAAFLIFATLHMMVAQKIKDIGILASMGASPSGIGAVFLFSGFVVGLVGCLSGLTSGFLTAHYFNDICSALGIQIFPPHLFAIDKVPVDEDPVWMLQVCGVALLLALIVSWLPARRASRADPVRALMRE